jgi:hypothetical protein
LEHSAWANAIWSQPALDKTKHAPFGQHGVGHYQEDDYEHDGDRDELKNDVDD